MPLHQHVPRIKGGVLVACCLEGAVTEAVGKPAQYSDDEGEGYLLYCGW